MDQVQIAAERDDPVEPLPAGVLDGAEIDGIELTGVLNAVPDAWERAELGRVQSAAGQTTPLDRL